MNNATFKSIERMISWFCLLKSMKHSEPFEKYSELKYDFIIDFKKTLASLCIVTDDSAAIDLGFQAPTTKSAAFTNYFLAWVTFKLFTFFRKKSIKWLKYMIYLFFFLQSWSRDWCILYFWTCTSDELVNCKQSKDQTPYCI